MNIFELIGETTEYDKKEMLEVRRPKSWCKSVSAFANGNGGCLIFGITDDDEIVGLENAENDAEIISEKIKVYLNPIPDFELRFEKTEDGKKLIILAVYAGNQTPYYYAGDGALIAFYRVGNQSVPVTPAKLKELVLKGSVASYDCLRSKYDFEDMSFTKLRATYKQRTGRTFEESDYESFVIVDEQGKLTNAGALLADESPIRHSRLFCTRWNGLDKAPGIMDALDDKEYSGGLINLLQAGTDFVANNSKSAWKKTATERIEMPDYPQRAVLEGLVNALIHRNYLEIGSEVHIDMFDDRVEIYSPGGMCDGSKVQERDLMRVPSRRRNPVIADIFNRLKYMERRGSGFKKILSDYRTQPQFNEMLEPEFYSDNDCFLLVLKNLNYSVSKSKEKKTNNKKQTKQTIENIEKIKQYLEQHGESKAVDIASYIGLSVTRTRVLLSLIEEVEPLGGNRNRKYHLK